MSRCTWCQGQAPRYLQRCEDCASAQREQDDSERKVLRIADEVVRAEALDTKAEIARVRKSLREAVQAMRRTRFALSSRYVSPPAVSA